MRVGEKEKGDRKPDKGAWNKEIGIVLRNHGTWNFPAAGEAGNFKL